MFNIKLFSSIKCLTIISVLGIAMAGVYGGWKATGTLWPGVHEDGVLYTTVVLNQANGLGNVYDVFYGKHAVSAETSARVTFNVHGQLYYPVISRLMGGADYASFLNLIHKINLAAFLWSIVLYYLMAQRVFGASRVVGLMFGTGCAYSVVGVLHYLQGRPEHGVVLILILFSMIRETLFRPGLPHWLSGLQIGLVAAMSPLPGVYLAVSHVFSLAVQRFSFLQLLRRLTIAGVVAMLCGQAVTSLVYAGSLLELIRNTLSEGSGTHEFFSLIGFPYFNVQSFIGYWLMIIYAPGIGVSYLLVIIVSLLMVMRLFASGNYLISKGIVIICLFVLTPQVWFISFYWPSINYTLISLFPSLTEWVMDRFGWLATSDQSRFAGNEINGHLDRMKYLFSGNMIRYVMIVGCLLVFSMPGIGGFRTFVLQTKIMRTGVGYQDALASYNKLKKNLGKDEVMLIMAYTGSSGNRSPVVFDGPPWKMKTYCCTYDYSYDALIKMELRLGIKGRYFMFLLNKWDTLPKLEGFKLIEDRLSNTPGYSYAIYEREF